MIMTENEAIERIKKESCYSENCHDGCLYGEENCAYSKAISALEEIQQYREIGTVEECREAREKQIPKKCIEDSCPDHTHYKCPSCGKIQKTKYDDSTFGCILNNCSNCGQALYD